jgi:hypothetical protein
VVPKVAELIDCRCGYGLDPAAAGVGRPTSTNRQLLTGTGSRGPIRVSNATARSVLAIYHCDGSCVSKGLKVYTDRFMIVDCSISLN